ncbi:hypothetical protein GOBAR_AA12098 [Gossypium barbadense]|uniref:Uncharacterized protein n=1 Tax=Gossypium barbadense TaxID=3634 RepID=A0A2P5XYX9_GOSBA|nr:hypothetical protein GOBAR_AA12098 [Gossypium barbadense]
MRSINSSNHHDHSLERLVMSSSSGKKTTVPASKKRKGASSSVGCCIDWAAVEQIQMADSIRALLSTDPWELFFGII